jgi:hypothetical protein
MSIAFGFDVNVIDPDPPCTTRLPAGKLNILDPVPSCITFIFPESPLVTFVILKALFPPNVT